MKKWIAGLLVWILAASLAAWPAGAEGVYATARTPVSSASEDQLTNIRLASASVDQLYVESGARFSFNETVGPRTAENGYVKAINGRGVKVVGGGVAQEGDALFVPLENALRGKIYGGETYTKLILRRAALGNDAGLCGAALYALEKINDEEKRSCN